VSGRVVLDGQAVPEPVPVQLSCGLTTLQVIDTDAKGYFHFLLGMGVQSNMDLGAASTGVPMTNGVGNLNSGSGDLYGCEVEVSVPGYDLLRTSINGHAGIGEMDVGTLQLRRLADVQGFSISVTSLLVPSAARKEFDKADNDVRNNHLPSAIQHLENAIAQYEKYAAAWSKLGTIYRAIHETEKANQAYAKAIANDPQYIPPYVGLATLELQSEGYESAIEYAGKALALNPRIAIASFIQAEGDFHLNRLNAAEKSARDAENEPHHSIPELHVLLAKIFLQKQDLSNAAAQMRAYLKESPGGPFAQAVKKDLAQIENNAGGKPGTPPDQRETAP